MVPISLHDITNNMKAFQYMFLRFLSICVSWARWSFHILWVRVAIAVIKHRGQKPVGKERVGWACDCQAMLCLERNKGRDSEGRNRETGTEAETEEWVLSWACLACPACLLIAPRTTCPGLLQPTVSWVFPTSITNEEDTAPVCPQISLLEASSQSKSAPVQMT